MGCSHAFLLLRLGPQAIKRRRLRPKEEPDAPLAGEHPTAACKRSVFMACGCSCIAVSVKPRPLLTCIPCCWLAVDAVAAAAEVAAALESEALASALRATDFERQLRLAAEAAAAEARQVSAFSASARPALDSSWGSRTCFGLRLACAMLLKPSACSTPTVRPTASSLIGANMLSGSSAGWQQC